MCTYSHSNASEYRMTCHMTILTELNGTRQIHTGHTDTLTRREVMRTILFSYDPHIADVDRTPHGQVSWGGSSGVCCWQAFPVSGRLELFSEVPARRPVSLPVLPGDARARMFQELGES